MSVIEPRLSDELAKPEDLGREKPKQAEICQRCCQAILNIEEHIEEEHYRTGEVRVVHRKCHEGLVEG